MAYTAVATWDITVLQAVNVSVRRAAVKGMIGDGVIHRRQTMSSISNEGQAAVRTFTVTCRLAPKTEYNRVVALWRSSFGGAQGISFTHSDTAYGSSETIIVRMKNAPLLLRQITSQAYSFRVQLEELMHSPGV